MTVTDVLREDVRNGSLMDNFVLCGESLVEVMGKYGKWKNAVEGKGLMVYTVITWEEKWCFEVVSFCCTVVKCVNVMLWMRRSCMGWSIV